MVLHALATAGKVAEREENYRLEKAEGRSGRGREGGTSKKEDEKVLMGSVSDSVGSCTPFIRPTT